MPFRYLLFKGKSSGINGEPDQKFLIQMSRHVLPDCPNGVDVYFNVIDNTPKSTDQYLLLIDAELRRKELFGEEDKKTPEYDEDFCHYMGLA